TQ
ncbi:hypothetical protein SLEP1_g59966, partial [Rubroshorea leprosula]